MKFTNETHKQILADIHEEVLNRIGNRDSSIRSSYEDGWMSAMSLAEDIINKRFIEQRKAEEADSSTADASAPQVSPISQSKVKGIVVMVRGKPIYQPMETGNENADEPTGSNVDHPAHYNTGKIEVIDFLEDQNLPFHLANAVKYICRAGKKNPNRISEDLQKAIWYINRYIGLVEDKPEPKSANEPGGSDHV